MNNIGNIPPVESFQIVDGCNLSSAATAVPAATVPAATAAAKHLLDVPQPNPNLLVTAVVSASAAGSSAVSAETNRVVLASLNSQLPQSKPIASSAGGGASAAAAVGAADYSAIPTPISHFVPQSEKPQVQPRILTGAALKAAWASVDWDKVLQPRPPLSKNQAIKVIEESNNYLSGCVKNYVLMGQIQFGLDRFTEAFDNFKLAATLNPENKEAITLLVKCYKHLPKSPENDQFIANLC